MRRRAASSPMSRAPAAPAHWTRRANSAPARRSRRKPGSPRSRMKSLADAAHWMLRAFFDLILRSREPLSGLILRSSALCAASRRMAARFVLRDASLRAAPQDEVGIPSQALRSHRETHRWVSQGLNPSRGLGVLLTAVALAWPGL